MMNVGSLLDRQADRNPHKLAMVDGGRQWTYHRLNHRANQLAEGFMDLGVQKGDRVGVLLPNCGEYWETYFALAKIGAVMVLINWRMSLKEIGFILTDAECQALVVHHVRSTELLSNDLAVSMPPTVLVVGPVPPHPFLSFVEVLEQASPEFLNAPDVALHDDQLLLYTSGTTGRPKGVLITHENTLWNSINQIVDLALTAQDSTLVICPLFHVSGLYDLTFPLLHIGGTVYIASRFDPSETLRTIEQQRITTLMTVPTMIYDLINVSEITRYNHSSLRLVVCGGAPLPVQIIEKAMVQLSPHFVQGYGLTEGTSVVTFLPSDESTRRLGSIGKPFLHVDLKLVDDGHQPVAIGEVGEIVIRGHTVTRGYWHLVEETRKAFRDGWLVTGDMARQDEDGFLYLVDRRKNLIISGGENIYPKEIEDVLLQHPAVREAAVVGVPDERWGEAILAVIVTKPGHTTDADGIREFCLSHLASYKKPRHVRFVEKLPRTDTGKVSKPILQQLLSGGTAPL